MSIDTLTLFICPWAVARNIRFTAGTLSNHLADCNPIPSSSLLKSHAEIKL